MRSCSAAPAHGLDLGGVTSSRTSGARLIPQFPATTAVIPWLTLGAIPRVDSSAQSSWVWESMKPGATTLPAGVDCPFGVHAGEGQAGAVR